MAVLAEIENFLAILIALNKDIKLYSYYYKNFCIWPHKYLDVGHILFFVVWLSEHRIVGQHSLFPCHSTYHGSLGSETS